ncbi:HAD-IA family hydrolase [Candidatus Woesearchaeota archaeon]|jgi:putative hydrolase of the HAD superfamily|nr:HAD-IA family hydrolase [Candidatus Woesearchaeota archaeon]MBT6044844.1 HAD-IA family hydrolase [Candidatus Woesearchaeota archaeon]
MPKLKAVLFDLEMTLFDAESHKKKSVELAAQAMVDAGLKMEKEDAGKLLWKEYKKVFHGSNVISDFLKNNNQFDPIILEAGINGYRKVWVENTESYPGVKETLTKLKSLGLRLAIVTDAPLKKALKRVNALGLSDFFEEVLGPNEFDDNLPRKPSPEPFLKALNQMGLKPEEAAYVGDWPERDIKGANEVGLISIHAKYGNVLSDNSYKGKSDYEINAFNELLGVIHSINQNP